MRLRRIQSLAAKGLSFDTETYRIEFGVFAPEPVCGSAGWLEAGPKINGALLTKQQALDVFVRALQDPDAILVGANISFDIVVVANKLAKLGFDVWPLVFKAFEEERIYDIQIAEALHAIAEGHLGKDPRTNGPLKDPETGKQGRYRLSIVVDLVLGRQDAKANDEWRLRYGELDGVPHELWPPAARDYPVDDARNTLEAALAQTGHLPKTSSKHEWANIRTDDGRVINACKDCGATRFTQTCMTRRMHRNWHEVANQTYSAFCLYLGAQWGFRVDQSAVDKVEAFALRRRAKLIAPFLAAGIVVEQPDGYHEVRSVLKRLVAQACGAKDPCPQCSGSGKVVSPASKPHARCPDCKGMCLATAKVGPKTREWRAANPNGCGRCGNTALIPNPNPTMINCVGPGDEMTCDGTGLVLTPDVPRSKGEGISYGRDTLIESGDEFLMSYGYYLEDAKILKDYVPYLRKARVPIVGHRAECAVALGEKKARCSCPGPYRDIILTLKPNAVLATGRVSYSDYIQLFPRAPGFIDKETGEYIPSIRECIVARGPQMELVDVPEGYVLQPGEEIVLELGLEMAA